MNNFIGSNLLGFTSIGLVFLFTLFLAKNNRVLFKVILTALIIRIILILIGHYITPLPDQTADALTFNGKALDMSQEGFINVISLFQGPNPYFISWIIAIPYSLFGYSILMAQSISLLFGIGSIFLAWNLAKKLWNDRIAIKVAWTLALFPSFLLYSVLILREVYVAFFLLLGLYGVVNWLKTSSFKSFIMAIFGFVAATFFHGAMAIGALIFMVMILIRYFKFSSRFKFSIKKIFLTSIVVFILSLYVSNKISFTYLGKFNDLFNYDRIYNKANLSIKEDASFPEWLKIKSPIQLFYKTPVRAVYFLFSPFPWEIKNKAHLIGLIDSTLYMVLIILILKNIRNIWRDPSLRYLLIILISYVVVFGLGVGNFGTSIRHKVKFLTIFILLAAPLIPRFIFSKKKTNGN